MEVALGKFSKGKPSTCLCVVTWHEVFSQSEESLNILPVKYYRTQIVPVLDTQGLLTDLMTKHYEGNSPLHWGMELYRLICLHYRGNQSLVYLKKDLREARVAIYKNSVRIRKQMPVMWTLPLWFFTSTLHKPKSLNDKELSWLTGELKSRSFERLTPMAYWRKIPVFWEDALITQTPVITEGEPFTEGVWVDSRISAVVEVEGEKRGVLVWCPL